MVRLLPLGRKTLGQLIVLREIKINDVVFPRDIPSLGAACLQEPRRDDPGFHKEKEADLDHVGAGRDVDEVILVLRIKGVMLREVEELRVHRAEVPGLRELREVDVHFRVR
ncbi:unknown [Sutterella sp. CAG:351]|nr:unknown [Sutterella sp. CAG:351]